MTPATLSPSPRLQTFLGWRVADIGEVTGELRREGVAFIRYEGLEQDDNAVWTTPAGDMVAWFADPDGNTLSLTQFAS